MTEASAQKSRVSTSIDGERSVMAEKTFTEALRDLQSAAAEIGRQATTLEDSLKLFDAGMKEAEYCRKILESAEQKIQLYENGELKDAQL